jgi:hypothetical protein
VARRALRSLPAAVALAALVGCSRESPAPAPWSAAPEPRDASQAPAAASSVEEDAGVDAAPSIPHVDVTNIGMHIGGGPNDGATKEPIARSVAPHFDDFRRCYAEVEPPRAGDFGADLLIEADGGPARVDHPRTSLGDAFTSCMVAAFERIQFDRPKTGKTKVSYSLRFVP